MVMQRVMLRTRYLALNAVRRPSCTRRYAPGARSFSSARPQQVLPSAEQVCQRARHLQSMQVLGQSAIANLVEAEQTLDHIEAVFDLGAHLRLGPITTALLLTQWVIGRRVLLRKVTRMSGALANHFALTAIGRVAPHPTLFSMQQVGQCLAVVYVGRAGNHRVDQLAATVHTDVCLHAEVPLISLLCLMHFGVALLVLVLRRRWGIDDGGIDDRSRAQLHSLALQVCVDLGKDRLSEAMLFQQVPELTYRGFIRRRLAAQIDAYKLPHRGGVV